MLFDWIWSSVTMASVIETAAENFVSLQFGFVFTVEAMFCCCCAYWMTKAISVWSPFRGTVALVHVQINSTKTTGVALYLWAIKSINRKRIYVILPTEHVLLSPLSLWNPLIAKLTCKLRKKVVQLYDVAFNKLYFISYQEIKKMFTLSCIIISTPDLVGLGGLQDLGSNKPLVAVLHPPLTPLFLHRAGKAFWGFEITCSNLNTWPSAKRILQLLYLGS